MTKTNTTIEINGKRYDARSGQPMPHAGRSAKSIDGVVRAGTAQPQKPTPVAKPSVITATKPVAKQSHPVAAHGKTQRPAASKTLMRQVVKKPAHTHTSKLKIQPRTDVLAVQPDISVLPKRSAYALDSKRERRASAIARSKLISRFGEVRMQQAVLASPAPDASVVAATSVVTLPSPAMPIKKVPAPRAHRGQRSMDVFQKALAHATSHEQKPLHASKYERYHKKHRKPVARLASVSSAALAVVLVGGFLAYQNAANVTLRLASAKAGFAASLPAYRPSGFGVGKLAYSSGNVTINFHSHSDDRSFALNEKPSNWDSDTLLNEFVASQSSTYQTVQTAGRTLYIYGDNNATWVNNGVWYQVDNNNGLSTKQLADIAASM